MLISEQGDLSWACKKDFEAESRKNEGCVEIELDQLPFLQEYVRSTASFFLGTNAQGEALFGPCDWKRH